MSSRFPSTPPNGTTTSSSTPTVPPPAPPRKRGRALRWLGRGFLALLGLLVFLVGGALAALHTDWGREQLRRQIVTVLRDKFPGGAELGRLGGSPLGTMTAERLVLYDKQHRPAIAVERAHLDVGLLALLNNTIQLEEVGAEGVVVQAFQDPLPPGPDGQPQSVLNLADLMKPSEDQSPSTWRVQIDELRLARASVMLTRPDPDAVGRVAVDHFDELFATGDLVMDPNGPLLAHVSAGGRWRERKAEATVTAEARIVEGEILVPKADATFGGLSAAIRDVRFVAPTNLTASVTVRAKEGALRELLPTLPSSPSAAVAVRVTPVAAGPVSAGVMRLRIDGSVAAATLSGDLLAAPLLARPHLAGHVRVTNVQPRELLGEATPPKLADSAIAEANVTIDAAAALPADGRPFSLDSVVADLTASAALRHGATTLPLAASAQLRDRRLTAEAGGAAGNSQLLAKADVTYEEDRVLAIHTASLFAHLTAGDVPAELRRGLRVAGVLDVDLRAQGGLNLDNLLAPEAPPSLAPSVPAKPAAAKPAEPPPAAPAAKAPLPSLAISGSINGTGLRYDTLAADDVRVEVKPMVIATWPRGNIHAAVTGLSSAGERLPNFEVTAQSETAGTINVQAHMSPRAGGRGKPVPAETTQAALAKAKAVLSATAAAATALSPATAAAAAAATSTANSATAAAAVATGKAPPAAPVIKPPSLLAAIGETGEVTVDASVKLGRDYRSATISLRTIEAAFQNLQVKGQGGQIAVRPQRLEIKDLELRSNAGMISVDGVRAGEQLTGEIEVEDLQLAPLAKIIPQMRGLSGNIDLRATGTLRGKTLQAEVRGAARDLVARPGAAVVDAEIIASVAPQLYHLNLHAKNGTIGEVTAELDVDPPADPFDGRAWQRLDRSAIRELKVKSPRVNLAAAQRAANAMAAAMAITTGQETGTLAELPADPLAPGALLEGLASVEIALTPAGGTLRATVDDLCVPGTPAPIDVAALLTLDGAGTGSFKASAQTAGVAALATAEVRLPPRPFDPASWTLMPERLPHASLEIPSFVITSQMASTLGLGDWRGRAGAKLELERGLEQLRGKLALEQMRGGPLQQPVTVVADLAVEGGQTKIGAVAAIDGTQAIKLEAGVPLSLAARGPIAFASLPLQGTVTIGPLEAQAVARAFGASARMMAADARNPADADAQRQPATTGSAPNAPSAPATAGAAPNRRRLQGTITGEGKLTGTVGDPALALQLLIKGLGNQRTNIRELKLDAKFQTGALHAELTGAGNKGGSLKGGIDLDVKAPQAAKMTLVANAFDLAPIARLVPSMLLGVQAQLDADLKIAGLDPKAMQVSGGLTLGNIRFPLANQVGALTEGQLKLDVQNNRATIKLDGKMEAGKVELRGNAALEGVLPKSAVLDLTVTDLALITPLTPTINGSLHADVKLTGGRWKVDAKLSKGLVKIPVEQGRVLHPVGPPPELVFVTDARSVKDPPQSLAQAARSWAAGRARNPWLQIALVIDSVTVRSAEATGAVRGAVAVDISDDGLSLDGDVRLAGGDVNLFGRRYQVDHAVVTFDGPLDPVIDAEIRHTFPQLVLNVAAVGRVSEAKLRFSSSPASYSEAQLLGFFLGGNPGSSREATPDAANSVAAAVASQTVGSLITKRLPVRIDVLSYQPQTLSTSGAFVAGRWITEKLLLLLRSRSDPRPLENSAEGELQYLLRRDLLLDGVAGDRGTFGLDLLWNRRW